MLWQSAIMSFFLLEDASRLHDFLTVMSFRSSRFSLHLPISLPFGLHTEVVCLVCNIYKWQWFYKILRCDSASPEAPLFILKFFFCRILLTSDSLQCCGCLDYRSNIVLWMSCWNVEVLFVKFDLSVYFLRVLPSPSLKPPSDSLRFTCLNKNLWTLSVPLHEYRCYSLLSTFLFTLVYVEFSSHKTGGQQTTVEACNALK